MWIVISIGILLALTPLFVGFLMSPYQQVTRVELIKASADAVWEALSDLSQQALWRTDLARMQMLDDDDGLRWVEQAAGGQPVVLRKIKEIPLKELLLDLRQRGSKGTRQARLSAVPGGTRVTFTETLETHTSIGRIKARMNGDPDKRLDHFIQQLKARFAV
ncbi:SRPBCC family protein [Thiothrix lacustris]|uniref:SRPBCC family protein n=1 Tax=Thiothrix lacustris TaxID=525917 RepID=A0ABY9MTA1_9GAMM|nr:SRPBCC family protein [Thiothrix lacustris]WML91386.1 SRPBCC family protein [Thiothrix lacustris]